MAPIKSTAFGYISMFTDKVEEDNFLVGVGVTYSTTQVFQPGNGYEYLIYTSPGYLKVITGGPVDILLVGGGGGGGNGAQRPPISNAYSGGGGGAGGYLEKLDFTLPIGEYDIRVGNGGRPGANIGGSPGDNRLGASGDPSFVNGPTITELIGYGGGGGGGAFDSPPNTPGSNGSDGGSGGGTLYTVGEGNRTTATAPATGSPIPAYLQNIGGTSVQGHPGGDSTSVFYAGGGGGAGGAGNEYPRASDIVNGGIGRAAFSDDPGIPPTYGTPGPTPGRYFAGGGGGGGDSGAGIGGDGGGGRGGDDNPPGGLVASTDGTANTGGGGGGGSGESSPTYKGKNGGSGIVIVRYKISL